MKNFIVGLAVLLVLTGCQAKKEAKKAAAPKGNSQAYIETGMNYLKDGDIGNAIKSFDMAIRVDPQNIENYMEYIGINCEALEIIRKKLFD